MTMEHFICSQSGHGYISHIKDKDGWKEYGVCDSCGMTWNLTPSTQPYKPKLGRLISDLAPNQSGGNNE